MDLPSVQSLWYLLFLAIPLSVLIVQSRSKRKPTSTGLKPHPLLGNFLEYLHHRHRYLEWVTETMVANPTHTMGIHIPCLASGIITANPANVEHLLKTKFENYPKGWSSIFMAEDFLGQGIFNSDGEEWRAQRKTASFEFNKRSLRSFVVDTVRGEVVGRLLPLLEESGDKGEAVDLQDVLERFAFDNICRVAFGVDPASLGGEGAAEGVPAGFMKDFDDATGITFDRFMYAVPFAWWIKKLLNVGTERRLRESISTIHGFAAEIVHSRKLRDPSCCQKDDDLLSRFASSGDHTEEFLRDVVVNFLLAGRDTTSSALTWFFWVLSSRPDVEKKILEEVASIRARSRDPTEETFGFEELREMHYLHAAISESLRLHPPVVLDAQECLEDDVLPDGTFVGRGWFTMYSAYAMGRVEDIWGEDCKEYRPERWLDAGGVFQPESPFRFPVFHAGPRMCLGREMAYIQMKSVAACVLERFAVEVVDAEKPREHVLSVTLRMKGGLPIRVTRRADAMQMSAADLRQGATER